MHMSKTDMARAIVQRLENMPHLPAADHPYVTEMSGKSAVMLGMLFAGPNPYSPPAVTPAPTASPHHVVPQALHASDFTSCSAAANVGTYDTVLHLDEAEAAMVRDAVELLSTRSYSTQYRVAINRVLGKIHDEELKLILSRIAAQTAPGAALCQTPGVGPAQIAKAISL